MMGGPPVTRATRVLLGCCHNCVYSCRSGLHGCLRSGRSLAFQNGHHQRLHVHRSYCSVLSAQRSLWQSVRHHFKGKRSTHPLCTIMYSVTGVYMMNCISHRLLPRRAHCLENSPELQPPSSDVSLATTQTPPSVLEQIMLVSRLVYLTVIFSPSFLLYGLGYLFNSSYLSELAWRYVLRALQVAGPAFIKLGQWASVRRDIFSEEFCRTLSNLHTRCDPHHWRDTVRILEENFGPQWQQTLVILDHTPVGSGCVAQVYKGYLNPETLSPTPENPSSTMDGSSPIAASVLEAQAASSVYIPVAIKVLHPGVVEDMNRDIGLMRYVASWVDWVYPDVHWVALRECVEEFSESMIKQVSHL